jgi:hypothetical protein
LRQDYARHEIESMEDGAPHVTAPAAFLALFAENVRTWAAEGRLDL